MSWPELITSRSALPVKPGAADAADWRLARKTRHVRVRGTFSIKWKRISVLPDLTDQDLEKLGVVLGDRRKMLRAIASLEALKNSGQLDRCTCGFGQTARPLENIAPSAAK